MLKVTPIAAFNDNYIWVIQNPGSALVAVVDPGDAQAVQAYLNEKKLVLAAILVTHHHPDHTGGIKQLVEQHAIPVYGPANSPCQDITHPLHDGDHCLILNTAFDIKHVPGHTLDHISYYNPTEQGSLFCGDTLFLAGCGRLFEGTPTQMLHAMKYFAQLPDDTKVYCTHEYSLANLAFATAVEPDNQSIVDLTEACQRTRLANKPTLPSSIGQEKLINPFMRTHHTSLVSAAEHRAGRALSSEDEVFAQIRLWKDEF